MQLLIQGFLQFPRHDVFDLIRVVGVHADQPQVIADQIAGVMVGDDLREILKCRTLGRLFDVRFERHVAFGTGQPHQEIHQAQQLHVIGLLVDRAFQDFAEAGQVCFTSCMEFAITKAPTAAPPIVQISNGNDSPAAHAATRGEIAAEHADQQKTRRRRSSSWRDRDQRAGKADCAGEACCPGFAARDGSPGLGFPRVGAPALPRLGFPPWTCIGWTCPPGLASIGLAPAGLAPVGLVRGRPGSGRRP